MKVINPLTKKLINVNGVVFKNLLKKGYIYENNKLIKKPLNLIDNILLEASPNDLLSLYLTDLKIKKTLNSKPILNLLNVKYNVQSNNFIQFFKSFNIKNISEQDYKTLYLYHLENTLYKPIPNLKDRVTILTWLYDISKKLKLNYKLFGLACTLFDSYPTNTKEVALICLYISNLMLEEYVDINQYLKIIKMKKTIFFKIYKDIIVKLNGYLIRPSTVFFTSNVKLTILSYLSNDLLKYNPSLIAETINYITTGEYKIYTLTEFSNPCKILKSLSQYKTQCAEKNKVIQNIIIKNQNSWHIGDYNRLNIIGKGAEGVIYKIKNKQKYYVLKTVKNNIEPVSIEISTMRLLSRNPFIITMAGFEMYPKKVNIYLDLGHYSLYDGIVENKLPKNKFWHYIKNITRGIDYCHYNDIIHRDIKPENIIYDGKHLKLIDFGLSVPYSSFKSELDPDLAATMNYRAPEALLGDIHYNNKIDIWALGLVIYFMIIGDNLFKNDVNVFKLFGSPTLKSWPEAFKLPLYKKTNYKKKSFKLGPYSKIFNMCTVLNPQLRANTSTLLPYIEAKL